ncbi:MAG: apolipoprotein N-acyltransferase [Lentisphaeria bacterium]|nr:apolipoprotein N-acyltransferase [Lentisphaeria bacterium]
MSDEEKSGRTSSRRFPILLQITVAIASAGLLILGYPPFGFWPCVLLAWAGFFVIVFHASPRSSTYLGLALGLVAYGGSLQWLRSIFEAAAVPLYGILSLFVALPALVACLLSRRVASPWFKAFLAATLFAAFEFFRCELFFLEFPWISAGSALGPNWLTPVIGVYGCSFLIFTAAACLVIRETRAVGIGLAVVLLGLYLFPMPVVAPDAPEAITVAVVQGEELNFDEYVELSRKTLGQSPKLIVWPEYALPYDVRQQEPQQVEELRQLAESHDTIFVLGTKTKEGDGEREWRNTALTIGKNGVLGEYYKNHTVHFFNDGIAGTNADPVSTPIGLIGAEVCFDCDYEDITRELVRKGAEVIVAPTFDARHWKETQHKQHAVFFQLRAAENRRWLICAASSGYSRIIDPHGRIHQSLPFASVDAIVGKVVPQTGRTFYNWAGWLVPWGVMLAALVLSALAALRSQP